MGASKPLAYCQDLQVAADRAKPSGGDATRAPSSRIGKLNRQKELIRRNRDTTVAEVLGVCQKSSRLTLAVPRLTDLASYENPGSSPIEAFIGFEP